MPCAMKNLKIWIFILFTGLLSIPNHCNIINEELVFNGQKSGLYFVHTGDGRNGEGVSYLFEKINDVAIHAIFEYKYSDYATNVAKDILIDAIKSNIDGNGTKSKKNWKPLLEKTFKSVEEKLMNAPDEMDKSRVSVAVVIVDGNTVIQGQVGNLRIISITIDGKISAKEGTELSNILGGKSFKRQNSFARGDAQVNELKNTKFIIMGTMNLFGPNNDDMLNAISSNMDNMKNAAEGIAQLMTHDSAKNNNAVIVIGLNPPNIHKAHSVFKKIQKMASNPFASCMTAQE